MTFFSFLSDGIYSALKEKLLGEEAAEREKFRTGIEAQLMEIRSEFEAIRRLVGQSQSEILSNVFGSVKRTAANEVPNVNPLSEVLRDIAALRWNAKLLGAALANQLYEAGFAGPSASIPQSPSHTGLKSKLCVQADIESQWLQYWCGQLRVAPIYSRKIWEYGYVLQALWEAGVLEAGRAGLGFAVGNEPTPAFFASRGINTLATDLSADDPRSKGWSDTAQHAGNLSNLFKPEIVTKEFFEKNCQYRQVDMNQIPFDLDGKYDFCWSMCSFEHVGSIELGLEFVINSIKCLKPNGIAVHTTEFSFEPTNETIDNWPTVLFQPRHIEELDRRLKEKGHRLLEVDYDPGEKILDRFIDGPPYFWQSHPTMRLPDAPHLRLNIDGFPATSIGLIIRAAPD